MFMFTPELFLDIFAITSLTFLVGAFGYFCYKIITLGDDRDD